MTRSMVLSVAVVATIGAVLVAQLSDYDGHAASPPAGDGLADLAVVTDPRVT
jgi:hypothetical protein